MIRKNNVLFINVKFLKITDSGSVLCEVAEIEAESFNLATQ